MRTRGLSSRAVLVALAIVAVGTVVALLSLGESGSTPGPASPTASESAPTSDPRSSLEGTSESASARAGAPESKVESSATPAVGRSLAVSGTIVDARTRAGLPDVEVQGFVKRAPGEPGEKWSNGKTVTDAEGRYSLEVAWDGPPPTLELRVRGERVKREVRRIDPDRFQPIQGTEGKLVASEDIEVVSVFAVRGRIVSESDGGPIRGGWKSANLVRIEKAPALPQGIPECFSDVDQSDRFLIQVESMVPGELAVIAAASGHLARMKPASLDASRTVDIGDIALPVGACIEGVVSTADGSRPLATHVFAQLRTSDQSWIHTEDGTWTVRGDALVPVMAQATIAPDGTFRLCELARDRYVLLVDYDGCRTPSRLDSLEVQAPASDVRITISTAIYRLRVFDARSGEKLERARFHFDNLTDFDCGIGDGVIATDPATESPGKIVAEGYRTLKCSLPALAASEVRNLEFRLEPIAQLVTATIVVASPAGDPVQDVEVEIEADAGEVDGQGPMPRLSHNAPDGRHDLPKLAPGTYHLLVEPWRDGDPAVETWLGAEIELHVREGMKPIEVRFEEGGLVQATLTRMDAAHVEARTSLVRTDGREPEPVDWRNDAGTFAGWIPGQTIARLAKPLPVGTWTLRFEANGCATQDVAVNVVAGATTTIAVVLEPKPPR